MKKLFIILTALISINAYANNVLIQKNETEPLKEKTEINISEKAETLLKDQENQAKQVIQNKTQKNESQQILTQEKKTSFSFSYTYIYIGLILILALLGGNFYLKYKKEKKKQRFEETSITIDPMNNNVKKRKKRTGGDPFGG